mmetsp:Transcript_20576/g.61355  ORF Transcript_20576/g.61355 Transcript_20576/m.61355 type:complete len:212 (-) Transcript_20576:260-895(-)
MLPAEGLLGEDLRRHQVPPAHGSRLQPLPHADGVQAGVGAGHRRGDQPEHRVRASLRLWRVPVRAPVHLWQRPKARPGARARVHLRCDGEPRGQLLSRWKDAGPRRTRQRRVRSSGTARLRGLQGSRKLCRRLGEHAQGKTRRLPDQPLPGRVQAKVHRGVQHLELRGHHEGREIPNAGRAPEYPGEQHEQGPSADRPRHGHQRGGQADRL